MIVKATPSLILASLLVGIIVGVALASWLPTAYILLGAIVVVDVAFVAVKRAPWRDRFALICCLILGIALGAYRYQLTAPRAESVLSLVGVNRAVTGTIVDREGDTTGQQLILSDLTVDGVSAEDRVLVVAPGVPEVQTGEIVNFTCRLEAPEPFDGFRYDRYLATKDIYATCFVKAVPFVVGESGRFVTLDRLHDSVLAVIQKTFGEPQASLLAGLLMGDDHFSDAWKGYFLRTGTSHVVAASGANVAMLSLVLMAALIGLGLKRQQAYPIILLGILSFVIVAGGGAAVTRAGIMGALVLTATQLGRKTTPRNIILLTVALMLIDNPLLLRDDAGFQLSVMSTIGLVTMSKYFSEKCAFIPDALGLREAFATTIAATIATLPIVVFGFGRFSIISPFVNLLVLPFIPYAMVTGAVATLVAAFDPSLGAVVVGPAWLFLSAMLEIIQAMAALPFAVINLPF